MAHDDILNRLIASFSLRGFLLHPATLFVFASVGVIAGAIHLWTSHRDWIVDHENFLLTPDCIEINQQPEWCEQDMKSLVLENAFADQDVSLLDSDLIAKTVDVCKKVGWVEHVRQVEKSPQGLKVDLIYRGPVGMVELNHLTIPDWPVSQAGQLLPVDRQAVIMPGRLVAESPLLRFSIYNPVRFTRLENWTEWPDDRVRGASEIADVIQHRWQEFGLYRIVTFRKQNQAADTKIPYELWPDRGTQIIWGNPPGQEVGSEVNAEVKLRLLEEFVTQYGPLNRLAPARIDIRTGEIQNVRGLKTARLETLIESRK